MQVTIFNQSNEIGRVRGPILEGPRTPTPWGGTAISVPYMLHFLLHVKYTLSYRIVTPLTYY